LSSAQEFVQTDEWKEKSREINLEVLAVVLPLLIYGVSLMIGHYGFATAQTHLDHMLEIPDAFFGGCVLLAFSSIRGWSIRKRDLGSATQLVEQQVRLRTIVGLIALMVCSALAALAIVSQGHWALPVGLLFTYGGFVLYKNIVFRVALIAFLENEDD